MASVPNSGSAAPPPPPPVWDAGPAGDAQVAYGGFWIRLVAYLIDAILLTIVGGVLGSIFGFSLWDADWEDYDPTLNLVSVVIGWLYFALLESSERGATVGKMALGLRVVTGAGQRLSFMTASGRYFAKIVSALIFFIGFIMIGFTERKRGLHDMIADTLVIKTR
ncbi:RDD family protein [soil metagenome]